MRTHRNRLASPLVAVLTALAMSPWIGCGDDEPAKPPTPAAQAPPAQKPQPVAKLPKQPPKSVKEQLAVSVALPDYYPKDAPVYPGTTPSYAGWQSGRVSAVFSTPDSSDDVVEWTTDFLESNGWEQVQSTQMDTGRFVQGFKLDEDRKISALVSKFHDGDEEVTLIVISTDP